MQKLAPFHLAIPVSDLQKARDFYGGQLGCKEGRSAENWVDFDFFGHQLVAHMAPSLSNDKQSEKAQNLVDGHHIPVPHFGVVLPWGDWQDFSQRLKEAGVTFIVQPHTRFKGQAGEQATLFFADPFGNALEFKSFKDPGQLFQK
jgi:hypothetical protein